MNLSSQKRIASKVLKVGISRVWLDPEKMEEIKKAITKADMRALINKGSVRAKPAQGISKFRSRKIKAQKRKGRRKGEGTRKGARTARLSKKEAWKNRMKVQRGFVKMLKHKKLISSATFRIVYKKIKGGFFRSKRHVKTYLKEQGLFKEKLKNA